MIGHEMELFNVTLWLAPGMNIHRIRSAEETLSIIPRIRCLPV